MLSILGMFSTIGDILSTAGCSVPWGVMSTVGDVRWCGGILPFTEHPHGTHDIHHSTHDTPLPTVLNTPTVLRISPHGTEHPVPHATEHTLYRVNVES